MEMYTESLAHLDELAEQIFMDGTKNKSARGLLRCVPEQYIHWYTSRLNLHFYSRNACSKNCLDYMFGNQ